MTITSKEKIMELAGELNGISALTFVVSHPLMEEASSSSECLLGEALHAIASYVQRIAEEMGEIK